ncbi:hypothetical protein EDEG_03337 [Edhazardia aedis USNM 41457]|uniref:Uncharacterized protein n=1 Tax=Edhazardia aedis (strain USNM 41457) TaxID=1003232 RepID=J9D3U9_EDHAE|nr:hypothetical protein EDEG_03337 [Edhazardia aedis USNM 41457]|eukprot:EJW02219.1 hypothetical protein EDEG_03337 [Edhazardia aedis USNM 41457]
MCKQTFFAYFTRQSTKHTVRVLSKHAFIQYMLHDRNVYERKSSDLFVMSSVNLLIFLHIFITLIKKTRVLPLNYLYHTANKQKILLKKKTIIRIIIKLSYIE